MKRFAWLLPVAAALLSSPSYAQKAKKKPAPVEVVQPTAAAGQQVTLAQTLEFAVKGNYALATSQLDVSIEEANVAAAEGVDDFIFDANTGFRASKTPAQPGNDTVVVDQGSYGVNLGAALTKPFRSGGQVKLEVGMVYSRSNIAVQDASGNVVNDPDAVSLYIPTATLSFFQPLLRGRGSAVARAQQARARSSLTVAQKRGEAAVSTVIRDVVQGYWELAYAAREVEIRKQSLALAQEQLRITRARLDVGVGAPTDVTAVEQGVASREEELLVAELTLSERGLNMRRLSGMQIAPEALDLSAADKLETTYITPDAKAELEKAIAQNADIQVVRAQGAAARIDVEVNENGLLPQLDLSASLSTEGFGTSFGSQFDPIFDGDSYTAQAGLVFSMPIGNHTAKGLLEASRRSLRRVKVSEDDIKQQISVAVVQAVNVLRSTQKRVETLEKSTRLAQENLNAEKARFEVGRTTNFEVLRRQEELAQSQLRQARAAADYLRGVATLETLTGDLLPRHGIKVTPK
jgi:outer membrane protein